MIPSQPQRFFVVARPLYVRCGGCTTSDHCHPVGGWVVIIILFSFLFRPRPHYLRARSHTPDAVGFVISPEHGMPRSLGAKIETGTSALMVNGEREVLDRL